MKTCLCVLFLAALAAAQQSASSSNPVTEVVRNQLQQRSKLLTAAAEQMPAGQYGYKPTPQQESFGHVVMHIAQSNNFLCGKLAGQPAPELKLNDSDPKDKLISEMKNSFSYCQGVLDKLQDAQLGEPVTLFGGRQSTKAGALIGLSDDLYDHYAGMAMYLRLKGMLPPSAQPRRAEGSPAAKDASKKE